MLKSIHSRKPHRCEVCGKKTTRADVLSTGWAWFCSWDCWNEKEAEEAGKEVNQCQKKSRSL